METTSVIKKPKQSVKLTKEEVRKLKNFMKGKTGFEASVQIGVAREVLIATSLRGSAAEKSVTKIREFFKAN